MAPTLTKTALMMVLGAVAAQACTGPPVAPEAVDLVAQFEGFRPDVYVDPTGNPTVGYGHLCTQGGCAEVPYPIPLSEEDGKKLLASDLASAQDCITNATADPVTLNLNQYGALVSWAFNVGCGNVRSSTLISRLNAGEDPTAVASDELPQWNKGNGEVLPGLVKRRAAEVEYFKKPTDQPALPAQC